MCHCLTFEIQKLSESLDFYVDLIWLVSLKDINTSSHENLKSYVFSVY